MDDRKTATLNLRVSPAKKAAMERAAKADGRSITNFIEKLFDAHILAQKARK